MHSLLRTLEHYGVPLTAAKAILVVALFVAASLLARLACFAARVVQAHTSNISIDSPLSALVQCELAVQVSSCSSRAGTPSARRCRWLGDELLPSLIKERAGGDLIVHGPVILPVDESASTRYARAQRLREVGRRRAAR